MKEIYTVVVFDKDLKIIKQEDCGPRKMFAAQCWDDVIWFHKQHDNWIVLEMYIGTEEHPLATSIETKRLK